MFYSLLPSILVNKKPPEKTRAEQTAERLRAELEKSKLTPVVTTATSQVRPVVPSAERSGPSRPTGPSTPNGPSRPLFGRNLIKQSCICTEEFASGGFKTAHDLNCNIINGKCYPELKDYTNENFVALSIRDKTNSNIHLSDQWVNIIEEVKRQQHFVENGLAVNIPMVILVYNEGESTFINSTDYETDFYQLAYPPKLARIILIMQRITPPGSDFDAIGLADRLVSANVFSGDFKVINVGVVGDNSVLIDWDPKLQVDIDHSQTESVRRELVCYMVLTFLMELIDYMAVTSHNIINSSLDKAETKKLTESINLFSNTHKKLKEYYPSIFTKGGGGRAAILAVIKSAETAFGEKSISMFLNLINYDPIHNIQSLLSDDKTRQTNYSLNKPDPNLPYRERYIPYKRYIDDYFMNYIPFDINCLLNMTFEPSEVGIENQIITYYLDVSGLSTKPKGGSRKRSKTKHRRSYKKKKGTRKMFR